jgi:nuclear GTP-binding protein
MARTKRPTGSSPKVRSSSLTGASGGVALKRVKGENFYQNAKHARRLKMLARGKPIRGEKGFYDPGGGVPERRGQD